MTTMTREWTKPTQMKVFEVGNVDLILGEPDLLKRYRVPKIEIKVVGGESAFDLIEGDVTFLQFPTTFLTSMEVVE